MLKEGKRTRVFFFFLKYIFDCFCMAVLHNGHFYFKPKVGIEKHLDIHGRFFPSFLFLGKCFKNKN